MKQYDVVVIGGGPAGMGAALASAETGAKTLIIERDNRLGGILNQCIHNGFGLHYFKEELTGPEYAYRFVELVSKSNIDVMLNTFVTKIDGKKISIISPAGAETIEPKAIILAMGCRERTAGNIKLCGTRPAGVMTAGQVQKLVNFYGKLPGKRVVILGSGDIGLIMARRLTYEGAKVLQVLEVNSTSSGLARNIRQCLEDYNIPIQYNTTITEVVGTVRIKGVKFASVDSNMNIVDGTEKYLDCDLLVLSVGLQPEYDVLTRPNIDKRTGGLVVNEYREISEGVFACGNVLHVHDLVDNVTVESSTAGRNAGMLATKGLNRGQEYNVYAGNGIRYTVPSTYYDNKTGELEIYFRVNKKYVNGSIVIYSAGEIVKSKRFLAINPSEMESIAIDKAIISKDISIAIKEDI
ncbi:MAG: FAD-dependent oxidoreductase [Clostridiales bacterium]|nr:FAD-dependent oxidoreductase [Clostridiales bacterium]